MAALRRSPLLAACRSLPHATEDVKWGNDLCFSIGGKMFAVFGAARDDARFSCKVSEEDFAVLTSQDGIRPADYVGRYQWIQIEDATALPEAEAIDLIQGSYALVKSKLPAKLRASLGGNAAAPKEKAAPKKAAPKKAAPKKAAPKKAAAPARERPSAASPKKRTRR